MRIFILSFLCFIASLSADELLAKYAGKELKLSQLKVLFDESLRNMDLEQALEKRSLLLKQFTDSYLYHLALLDLARLDGYAVTEKSDDLKQQFKREQKTLSRWTEEKLLPKISVSYTEALLYFEENPKEFKQEFDKVYSQLKDFLKRQKLKAVMQNSVRNKWQEWSVENLVK